MNTINQCEQQIRAALNGYATAGTKELEEFWLDCLRKVCSPEAVGKLLLTLDDARKELEEDVGVINVWRRRVEEVEQKLEIERVRSNRLAKTLRFARSCLDPAVVPHVYDRIDSALIEEKSK